jgi:hypothetical protein
MGETRTLEDIGNESSPINVAEKGTGHAAPLIVISTGFASENAFCGVSVTVSIAALYTAERSLMLPAFLAVNEPCLPGVTSR